jgi:hypothetical protein
MKSAIEKPLPGASLYVCLIWLLDREAVNALTTLAWRMVRCKSAVGET